MELGNILFGNSRGVYSVVPRKDYEEIFWEFLDKNGFDMYGYRDHSNERVFKNNIFTIRPYYWGDDEEEANLPNFVYNPNNLKIKWYKYPMRDAYSNQDVDIETFKDILSVCAKSLKEDI